MKSQIFLILTAIIVLTSCRKFQSNFESLAMRCGVEPGAIDHDRRPFVLELESGEALTSILKTDLQARFIQNGQSGPGEALPISSGGCIFAPNEDGFVQAHAPLFGWHASFVQQSGHHSTTDLVLRKVTNFSISMLCPSDGLYSQGTLVPPLRIVAPGSLESIRIQVNLRNTQGLMQTLLDKPYGTTSLDRPESLLPPNLAEGSYQLQVLYDGSLSQWENDPIPQQELLCPITLRKTPPVIKGLAELTLKPILQKQGEPLAWYAESPIPVELRYCREQIATDEDLSNGSVACEPKAECQDEKNFQTLLLQRSDATGLFHYFLYAEDRAGNRTPRYCQRLAVSGSSPKLELSWRNPAWNAPFAVMTDGTLKVEADVAMSHPELADDRLLETMECRVDFRVAGKMIPPGKDPIFKSCGRHVQFSLSSFWKNQKAQTVEMFLHVRTSDTLGHTQEASRSVWIYPQRFQPELSIENADKILLSHDATLFAKSSQLLQQWDEASHAWKTTALPATGDISKLRVTQGREGIVYAVWQTGEKFEGAFWQDKIWQPLPDHAQIKDCVKDMQPHPKSGFWCQFMANTLLWQNNQWQQLTPPKSPDGKFCTLLSISRHFQLTALAADGTLYTSCAGKTLLKQDANGWSTLPAPDFAPTTITVDAKSRLWIRMDRFEENMPVQLAYLENNAWHTVDSVPKPSDPRLSSMLLGSPDGTIRFDDYVWNDASQSWERPQEIQDAWPAMRALTFFDRLGQEFIETSSGLATRVNGQLHHYPLTPFNLSPDGINLPVLDPEGRLWFLADTVDAVGKRGLYRIEPKVWQTYTEEAGITTGPMNAFVGPVELFKNEAPQLFFSDKGLIRGTDGSWSTPYPVAVGDGADFEFIFSDGRGNTYGHNMRRLFLLSEHGSPEFLRYFSASLSVMPILDSQGRRWFQESWTRNLWILDGKRLIPAPLPDTFKPDANIPLHILQDRIIVWAGNDIYRWNEEKATWEKSNQSKEGLPFSPRFVRIAGPDQFILHLSRNSPLKLFDKKIDKVTTLPLTPVDPMSGQFLITEQQGLLFLAMDSGLYQLKDGVWLQLLGRSPGVSGFQSMTMDRYQRLWISGTPFRLLRYDF